MGTAMVSAVAEDLAEFADVDLLWDDRLDRPACLASGVAGDLQTETRGKTRFHSVSSRDMVDRLLDRLARNADLILLIAPETDGCLERLLVGLAAWRSKLISPSLEFVSLTSNKNDLAQSLLDGGFQHATNGMSLSSFVQDRATKFPARFPVVVKPADGAGSEGVWLIQDRTQLEGLLKSFPVCENLGKYRIEQFVNGVAVSVSVIASSGSNSPVLCPGNSLTATERSAVDESTLILKSLRQQFGRQPFGNYLGAVDDLSPLQIERAQDLVSRLLPFLPVATGYFGVDIVLGEGGAECDTVIEVNPRLTMSYMELRKIYAGNLALEMVRRSDIRRPD